VRTFRGAVLVGGIGTSEVDSVVVLGEDGEDFGAVAKFASLVHDNVLVGDVGSIASEPAIEPFDGRFLGATSGALDLATVVVGDSDVASFAVESGVLFETLGILRSLNDEAEIDAEALKAGSGFARVVFASSRFTKFGGEADGTVVDLGGDRKLRDTFDELVGFGEAASVTMGKSLVPKDALGVTR
jgi:hypothetical protein